MENKIEENLSDQNMRRIVALPASFGEAIETITDNLDKDWQNKIVFPRYVAELCDIMEEGIAQGKSLEDIIGMDPVAYARNFQSTRNYREIEATPLNKQINFLMGMDFLVFVGASPFAQAVRTFLTTNTMTTFDIVLFITGIVLMAICFIVKGIRYKRVALPMWTLLVQPLAIIVIGVVTQFEYAMVITSFLLCIGFDYFYATKKATV